MAIPADNEVFDSLREVLASKSFNWSDMAGIGGTGAPGLLLERLLGFDVSNKDGPDSKQW